MIRDQDRILVTWLTDHLIPILDSPFSTLYSLLIPALLQPTGAVLDASPAQKPSAGGAPTQLAALRQLAFDRQPGWYPVAERAGCPKALPAGRKNRPFVADILSHYRMDERTVKTRISPRRSQSTLRFHWFYFREIYKSWNMTFVNRKILQIFAFNFFVPRLLHLLIIFSLIFSNSLIFVPNASATSQSDKAIIPEASMPGINIHSQPSRLSSSYGSGSKSRGEINNLLPTGGDPSTNQLLKENASETDPSPVSISAAVPYTLTLQAEPPFITPGNAITIFWEIKDWSEEQQDLQLFFSVPTGVTPEGNYSGTFDPEAKTLIVPANSSHGHIRWSTSADSVSPFIIEGSLYQSGKIVSKDFVRFDSEGLTSIPAQGGKATGLRKQVSVTFPNGAADEPLDILIRNLPPTFAV